ncbi:MAG: hypothetical protein IKR91_04405, partial [Alloprevotella sp.]|nr:hypothetical protein [Alloprevotella sp.]
AALSLGADCGSREPEDDGELRHGKMKFGQAVKSGQKLRLTAWLEDIQDLRGTCKTQVKFQIDIEGERKPALSGVATFLYYFEN